MQCIKVIFVGAAQCGKTSLIQRYISSEPPKPTYEPTVGSAYSPKILTVHGNSLRLDIWELGGSEWFSILAPMIYAGAHVVVVGFDVSDKDHSYERALIWVDQLNEAKAQGTLNSSIVLLGMKSDLKSQVDPRSAEAFCTRSSIEFFEVVSSISSANIEAIFSKIAEAGLKNLVYSDTSIGAPPEWVPDSSCKKCCHCSVEFTLTNRRHHCRACGFIFCGPCSSKRLQLTQFGISKPVRVCLTCFGIGVK